MTQGNHECYGGGCYAGSTNGDHVAFMTALAPISSTPYYTFDVTTSSASCPDHMAPTFGPSATISVSPQGFTETIPIT